MPAGMPRCLSGVLSLPAGVWFVGGAGGAVPVFGNGAGTGSGTVAVAAGSAAATPGAQIAAPIAATRLQDRAIAARRMIGAIAIRPDFAGRCGAIIPLPPMRCIRTPRYARPVTHDPPETSFAKCALWQIHD